MFTLFSINISLQFFHCSYFFTRHQTKTVLIEQNSVHIHWKSPGLVRPFSSLLRTVNRMQCLPRVTTESGGGWYDLSPAHLELSPDRQVDNLELVQPRLAKRNVTFSVLTVAGTDWVCEQLSETQCKPLYPKVRSRLLSGCCSDYQLISRPILKTKGWRGGGSRR